MSKPVKELITRDLQARYGQTDAALWVELLGADGITTNEFRRDLRGKAMRLEMVRNAMLRRACADGPLARLAAALHGPAALITGGESLVEVAKVVEGWIPKIKGMRMRGALFEGEYLDERRVVGLSRMPTKRDVQGQVVGAIRSPGARLAAAILAPAANIAGGLKALIETLEKGQMPAAA